MEWVVMGLIISKRLVWEKRPRYPNPKTAPVEDIIRLGQEYMTSWELVRLVPSHKTQSLVHSKKIHETWLKRTCLLPRAWRTAHPSFKNVNMEFHFTNSFSIDHLIKMSFAAYGVALQLINKKKIKMRNYRKRNYLEIRPLRNQDVNDQKISFDLACWK